MKTNKLMLAAMLFGVLTMVSCEKTGKNQTNRVQKIPLLLLSLN